MLLLKKHSAISLVFAGILFAIPNTVILPFVDFRLPFGELLVSTPFLYRMIIAALTVALLLFGSIGIFLHHEKTERAKLFRNIAFIIAFFGSAFMLANEWHQIFVLPDVANINPKIVDEISFPEQAGRYSIGAMIALSLFSLGWMLFSIYLLIAKLVKRWGPILVLTGFFIIPLLSATTTPIIGGIVGGVFLGTGFSLIGIEVYKSREHLSF